MSSSSGEHFDGVEQVATGQALSATREQKRRNGKRNLRHGGHLKLGLPTSTPTRLTGSNSSNDEEQLLQQCQAIYSKLPKRSRYAQHKLKCLSKAMELLQRGRAARTQEDTEELQSLLSSLNIGSTTSSKAAAAPHNSRAAHGMECEMEQDRQESAV